MSKAKSKGTEEYIINLLKRCLDFLNIALVGPDDEISRNHEMTQFSRLFYEFDYLHYDNQNFIDVVNVLRVGMLSKLNQYSLQEIVCLKTVINDLMQNLNMPDKIYFEILDRLEQNNFNITGHR